MAKKSKSPSPASKKPTGKRTPPSVINESKFNYEWIALGAVVLGVSLVRLRLASMPLERDEGEYAYIGKLILNGTPPYTEAYNMKLPGTYGMYAIIMEIFGATPSGIHYGLVLVNAAAIIFFFLAFKKLFNPAIGFFSASVFGIMSVSSSTLGFAAHATHFVCLFVAIAMYFMSRFYEDRKLKNVFLTGLMFGLAFLMKQQAVFFILFGGVTIILVNILEKKYSFKLILSQVSVYSAGVFIPYIITVLTLAATGAFKKFWFWTVTYAINYATGATLKIGLGDLASTFKPMWQEFWLYWILFFLGIILTFLTSFSLKQKLIAILFALVAFLTIVPGLYFRSHYFISFLPGVGLLGGISIYYLTTLISKNVKSKAVQLIPILVFSLFAIFAVARHSDFYMTSDPRDICKTIYGDNPFNESIEIADYIKRNTDKTDKIAVLGSEPQIFFYADRPSATGYIYAYSIMEVHDLNRKMQDEMIMEIEQNKPKIIVYSLVSASWMRKPDSPAEIFDWTSTYLSQNYQLVGIVDIGSNLTNFAWDEDAKTYQHKSSQYMMVYKRNVN